MVKELSMKIPVLTLKFYNLGIKFYFIQQLCTYQMEERGTLALSQIASTIRQYMLDLKNLYTLLTF